MRQTQKQEIKQTVPFKKGHYILAIQILVHIFVLLFFPIPCHALKASIVLLITVFNIDPVVNKMYMCSIMYYYKRVFCVELL